MNLDMFNFIDTVHNYIEKYDDSQFILRKGAVKADYDELTSLYNRYSKKYEGYELKNRIYNNLLSKGYKIDDINRVMEDYERKKNKMEQNGIERKKKEEIKECQLKIMKNRAQYSRCKLKKVEGKGEVQWLFWKDKEIGEYIGPGLLGPTLVKFRHNLFKLEQIHMLVERAAPYKVFKI